MLQKTRRIPTMLALLILLFGAGGGILLAESSLQFVSRADTESKPREIRVTNKTSSMATISWITDENTLGAVRYGIYGGSLERIAVDDQILFSGKTLLKTHHVTLRDLKPQTRYAFIIQSDNKRYDNNGETYILTTFRQGELSNLEPAYGEIFLPSNEPATGSIVYLNLEGAEPLSTLVKEFGSWLIPMNIAYDSSSGLPIKDRGTRKVELFIRSPTTDVAQAMTDTDHDSPVPTIVVGKRYDFRLKAKKTTVEQEILGGIDKQLEEISFVIIQPEEQQAISSYRPLIRGKGEPGQKVSIIIESFAQRAVVTVDSRGNWSWSPLQNLPPGVHKVTVIAVDKEGRQIVLKRSFTVLPSGSSVLGEATPSATLAPVPTATPTPTFVPGEPTSTPTPTPVFALPTPIPTAAPDLETGILTPTIVFLGVGLLLVLLGLRPAFKNYENV